MSYSFGHQTRTAHPRSFKRASRQKHKLRRIRTAAQPPPPAKPGLKVYQGEQAPSADDSAAPQSNKISETLASKGLVVTLLIIFLSGLALNATPCVYPIIPITIGFFVNQSGAAGGAPRLRRTFSLARSMF